MSFTFNPFTGNFDYFDNLLPKNNTWTGTNTFDLGITIATASSEIFFNDVDQRIRYNDGSREVLFYPYDIATGGTFLDAKDNFWLYVDSTYVADIKSTSVTIQKPVICNDTLTSSGLGSFGGVEITGVGNSATLSNVAANLCYATTADDFAVKLTTTTGVFGTDAVSLNKKIEYNTTGIGFFAATPVAKPGATTDLGTVLSNLGLRTAGTAYPITTSGTVLISSSNHINFRDANTYINSPLADTLNINGNTGVNLQIAASSKMQITSSQCTFADAFNFVFNTVTGTKLGTGTTQKIGFFNATPVAQQSSSTDLGTVLSNLGFRASGTAYPITTSGAVAFQGTTDHGSSAQTHWDNAGLITKYNNIATVGLGHPAEYATVDLTGQAAAIAATTAYAVTVAGMFRVSWVATVTTAATTSSILGGTNGFQIKYTDGNDSVVKTLAAPVITSAANTTGTTISGVAVAFCKASTNLQYLMDYTSVGGTAMQYNLHIKVEAM